MKRENNAIIVTSIVSGVVLLIAVLALVVFQPNSTSNVVTVQGTATIKATPDLITVYYTIETKGATSTEANDANTLVFNNLVSALVAEGFNEEDLKTESFSIYPNTYWDGTKEKQDGYVAYHYLKLELSTDQSDKLSEVIDAGASSGASISYINFELTQESQNEYKAEALKMAAADAKIKADSIAEGFGKQAGKLVSVQTSDFGYYPWNVYTARGSGVSEDAAMAKESTANLTPSEQEITATISASFKLQ